MQVTVEDSGAGLTEVDMARLGERFFRVLGTSVTGSGLGWSIVRHIAHLQQVDVQVGKSVDLGGLQVILRFPAQ
jgi:two-component system sensor histidine kinase QseC